MADVIALPTAAAEPPPRSHRRGAIPKAVSSFKKAQRRKWNREQLAKAKAMELYKTVSAVLKVLTEHAWQGEVAGLLIVWNKPGGDEQLLSVGDYHEDLQEAAAAMQRASEKLREAAS